MAFLLVSVSLLAAPLLAAPQAKKDWTFLMFINGDNNLDPFAVSDMKEMAAGGGSDENRDIICLLDREKGPAAVWKVEKSGPVKLKDMGELDMGDYKVLVKFVKDYAKLYPAKNYAVIMWNHGTGWKNAGHKIFKGISYDDSSGNYITTNQMAIAIEQIKKALGKKIDVFAFDACLMQMVEVAYALKDGVHYMVASEEVEPGEGYPYEEIMSGMKKGTTPLALAKLIVSSYVDSYNNGSAGYASTTQSVLDLTKTPLFIDALNGFSKAVLSKDYSSYFNSALRVVQKFYYRTNIDLGHFVTLLQGSIKDPAFQNVAKKLQDALKQYVVCSAVSGHNTQYATGLAIYMPANDHSFADSYSELGFAKDTLWEKMAKDFYRKNVARGLLADIENRSLDSLRSFVKKAGPEDKKAAEDVVEVINFGVFTERKVEEIHHDEIRKLLKELCVKYNIEVD